MAVGRSWWLEEGVGGCRNELVAVKHSASSAYCLFNALWTPKCEKGDHHVRDHMVVGFTTTYAISAYYP